jgi:hypothetical protein
VVISAWLDFFRAGAALVAAHCLPRNIGVKIRVFGSSAKDLTALAAGLMTTVSHYQQLRIDLICSLYDLLLVQECRFFE